MGINGNSIGGGIPAARFPIGRRILGNCPTNQSIMMMYNNRDLDVHDISDQFAVNFSDTVFGFLEQDHGSLESSTSGSSDDFYDDEDEDENPNSAEENQSFWDEQHKQLKDTLCKISSLELKVRNATKDAMKEAQSEGNYCVCRTTIDGGCRDCLMREIASRLKNAGYNSAVCKSKWRSNPDIPSGEHKFIDVIDNSKKKQVRIIIELNFRAEFEMARASEEYNKLIARLPEAFVGKAERVKSLIKILCTAAKKCLKDKKMHMAPWRKQKYMQAKWFKVTERLGNLALLPQKLDWSYKQQQLTRKSSKPASMLTIALADIMPNMHCKAVAVKAS